MVTYFLNWMGPVSNRWYEENNIPYTEEEKFNSILGEVVKIRTYETKYGAGRVDIHDASPFGSELGVPLMDMQSWNRLGHYLANLKTTDAPRNLAELVNWYEQDTGETINWFTKKF
ncbi:hypothetical protein P13BB106kb_p052 [Pectobacterium phage DU_PP_V]|uniref:Uncharacterized protein n=1 Tax=Pectobacterium phage DU_PP_V TaxID=2041492 RepID=A0A2D2W6W1_9CAUD|nr:hypothetical protein HOS40_gp117 [Pectobacterium phage DU_PP_V]ATS94036.1 hypothetical protein P13BB106kb_p052 [Pectobacterium phage DU_PP_V]